MELDFAGKGLTVVLLTICPQFSEAIAAAIASHLIFGMPWALSFAQGFTLGAVSPAVVVPSLMILHKADYGVKKGIPTTLIAAASFDDIIAITIFSVFLSVGITAAKGEKLDAIEAASEDPLLGGARMLAGGGGEEEARPVWMEIGFNLIQFIVGLILAFGVGYLMKFCNNCDTKTMRWPKFFFCLGWAIAIPVVCDLVGWPETKFVAVIFFGYCCYKYWGENKPEHEMAVFWMFCQPFLFGTVGAAVLFSKIDPSMIGKGFGTILIGVTARWLGTFMAACEKKYTYRERAFMAFAWIPKATVQAALGGICLSKAQTYELGPQYIEWGQAMLSTAVFSICITAPLGAIFINTLGTKWLEYDGDIDMNDDEEENATKMSGKNDQAGINVEPLDDNPETDRQLKAKAGATVVPITDRATIEPAEKDGPANPPWQEK